MKKKLSEDRGYLPKDLTKCDLSYLVDSIGDNDLASSIHRNYSAFHSRFFCEKMIQSMFRPGIRSKKSLLHNYMRRSDIESDCRDVLNQETFLTDLFVFLEIPEIELLDKMGVSDKTRVISDLLYLSYVFINNRIDINPSDSIVQDFPQFIVVYDIVSRYRDDNEFKKIRVTQLKDLASYIQEGLDLEKLNYKESKDKIERYFKLNADLLDIKLMDSEYVDCGDYYED